MKGKRTMKQTIRLAKIRSDTEGINIPVFCRDCKHEIIIDISRGQCFESRSR